MMKRLILLLALVLTGSWLIVDALSQQVVINPTDTSDIEAAIADLQSGGTGTNNLAVRVSGLEDGTNTLTLTQADLQGDTNNYFRKTGGRVDGTVSASNFYAIGVVEISYTGTNVAWDWDNGNYQAVTLTNNAHLDNPSNVQMGTYALFVLQDATGSRTLDYGSSYDFGADGAPTLTTDAGAEDVLTAIGRRSTNIWCASKLGFTP